MQQRYLKPIHVWALSLGCAVGWGAFVMPATTLLPIAGPVGTVLALVVGTLIMAVIAVNLHTMIMRTDEKGGVFAYTKKMFGYDHSFLCVWLLVLAYVSILWANATAFVLISRFLFNGALQFGFHYTVTGYDVYAGEILLTLFVIFFFGMVTMNSKRAVNNANAVMALIMVFGTLACTVLVAYRHGIVFSQLVPHFADLLASKKDAVSSASVVSAALYEKPHWLQVFNSIVLAPWAYVGFEAVSLTTGESTFDKKKSLAILLLSLVCGCSIYIAMTILSLLVLPDGCSSWQDYIMNLASYSGRDGLPVFHAAEAALGSGGLVLLGMCVISALSTSMIGLYRSASRILLVMAEDDVLPEWFSKTTHRGLPKNALLFIMLLSCVIPFLGRTAIGWIVDVTTISASIVYLYISACALKTGTLEKSAPICVQGAVGVLISCVLFFFPLIPSLWNIGMLATESYLIFAGWSIIGFVIFRFL